ncbi:MOT9-like protein [Mya arenaria]|uniref:MOT9-like protein n=1 Tax=Mya arenaria TaxID=6604 RepID=A0ABY7E343_MYAAR|nr:MOT9-like protein [Mya arenaria]
MIGSYGPIIKTKLVFLIQSVPLTYIPDLGVSKSLTTSEAATLISIVGITNIIGRIMSSLITDCLNVNCTHTYIVTLFMASAMSFLMPWCNGFATLAICSGVFGLCMATHVSMRTIVLADHLGIERLTRSFGLVALFQGVAFLTNAPLAGFLYETFDSYMFIKMVKALGCSCEVSQASKTDYIIHIVLLSDDATH